MQNYINLQNKLRQELANRWVQYYSVDGLNAQKNSTLRFTPTTALQGAMFEIAKELDDLQQLLLNKQPNETTAQAIERGKQAIAPRYQKLVELHKKATKNGVLGKDESWNKLLSRHPDLKKFVEKHISLRDNLIINETLSNDTDDYLTNIEKAKLAVEYASKDNKDILNFVEKQAQEIDDNDRTARALNASENFGEEDERQNQNQKKKKFKIQKKQQPQIRTRQQAPEEEYDELTNDILNVGISEAEKRRLYRLENGISDSEAETEPDATIPDLTNYNNNILNKDKRKRPNTMPTGKKSVVTRTPEESALKSPPKRPTVEEEDNRNGEDDEQTNVTGNYTMSQVEQRLANLDNKRNKLKKEAENRGLTEKELKEKKEREQNAVKNAENFERRKQLLEMAQKQQNQIVAENIPNVVLSNINTKTKNPELKKIIEAQSKILENSKNEKQQQQGAVAKAKGEGKKPPPMKSKPKQDNNNHHQTGQQTGNHQTQAHNPKVSFLPNGLSNY